MRKLVYLLLTLIIVGSCRSESNEETIISDTTTTTQTSSTLVKMNVVNSQNSVQKDIVIMMFKTKVTSGNNLPNIEKQVTSDLNGLATFDLSTYVTGNITQTYYFEAFKKVGNDYIWVSKTHPELEIRKNSQITTSIIIN